MSGEDQLSAFQRIFRAVKQPRPGSRFEGIGVVAILFGFALLAAALSAPRATRPDLVPLPLPDRSVLQRIQTRNAELARTARTRSLSFDVRAVGEAIRRFGTQAVRGKGVPEPVLGDVRLFVRRARELGNDRELQSLLAVQAELFVAATHAWEASGKVSIELQELGGDFMQQADESGWREGRRLVLDDEELATLFRMRWTELTGLRRDPVFAPTLDEYRVYYALYLRHPGSGADRVARAEKELAIVKLLAKRDPGYPASFARGVLLYQAGVFGASAQEFRAHLAAYPDGPWTLRAKNHLLAALAELPAEE